MENEYIIGQDFAAKYDLIGLETEIPQEHQYKIGQYVDILSEKKELLARFQVTETNGKEVKGKITNTFGHKRRRN